MRKILSTVLIGASLVVAPMVSATSAGAVTLHPIDSLKFDPPVGNASVHSVILPDGKLVVDNSRDGSVVEMNPDGTDQQSWVSGLSGLGGMSEFVDPSVAGGGFIYVAHAGNGSSTIGGIYRFNFDGSNITNLTSSFLTDPQDLAVDAGGNVFVADLGSASVSSAVWEVTFDGLHNINSVLAVAGGQFHKDASLDAITYDPTSGDLFVADQWNSAIFQVSFTTPGDGLTAKASYWGFAYVPLALAVNGTSLVVADLKYPLDFPQVESTPITAGSYSQVATLGIGAFTGITATPSGVTGVPAGTLFIGKQVEVTDPNNFSQLTGQGELERIDPAGNSYLVASASPPGGVRYSAVVYDGYNSQLLVSDEQLGVIYQMGTDGSNAQALITGWSSSGLDYPERLAVDPATGNIYVGSGDGTVTEFPPTGGSQSSGTVLTGATVPSSVTALTVADGNLLLGNYQGIWSAPLGTTNFVSWASPGAVMALDHGPDGRVYAAIYGGGIVTYQADGTGAQTYSLPANSTPQSIATDGNGRIFVVDSTHGLDELSTSSGASQVLDNTIQWVGVGDEPSGQIVTTTSTAVNNLAIPNAPALTSMSAHVGSEGSSFGLVINGTDFTGASNVEWVQNGSVISSAIPSAVSANQLTVFVPTYLNPGNYDVIVLTPGGASSVVASDQYTENPGPPSVMTVAANSGLTSGGMSINLYGQFFTGASAVTFGAQPATNFVVHSAGYLSATVPPSLVTGVVDVRVTTPYGTSSITASDHFTFNGPLVTSLSPVSGSTVGGKPLVINGKNFTGAKSVTVGSTVIKASAFVNQSATKITVKAPAHASGTVQVLVTTATGTSPLYVIGGTPNLYFYEGTPTVTGLSPATITHAKKTSVVITGTGLLGATKVVVGSAVATITANPSTTSLTVTTTALAKGSYYVQVTTVSGTSAKVAAAKLTVS